MVANFVGLVRILLVFMPVEEYPVQVWPVISIWYRSEICRLFYLANHGTKTANELMRCRLPMVGVLIHDVRLEVIYCLAGDCHFEID